MAKMERPQERDEGKLRRWVANLQLESWQLELLITGFSIFLLATSIDQYEEFRQSLRFNKLVPTMSSDAIFIASGSFIVNTIPYALKFFLISLLIHLLLRGFWIGIVGLSSVSNTIDFESLNLKGPFRKQIPMKVKTLDDLIFYLDQVSSVIFAYTYLLAFSILSVVLVMAFLFSMLGLGTFLQNFMSNPGAIAILSILLFLIVGVLAVGAIIFFLDTLFFSTFKKSKWFSVLYYPIYRVFSVISLSFLYRSIYYHLITNYKKKQIINVTILLSVILFISYRIDRWNNYRFYPETINEAEYIIQNAHYDDERQNSYIRSASIPSKFIDNNYLEVFIRYSPRDNRVLEFLCPESKDMENDPSFMDGFRAGIESQRDTTHTLKELLEQGKDYDALVKNSANCLGQLFEVWIDDNSIETPEFFFTEHENKGEKGFEVVLDISQLPRGRHLLSINRFEFKGGPFNNEVSADKLKMEEFVKISFWKE